MIIKLKKIYNKNNSFIDKPIYNNNNNNNNNNNFILVSSVFSTEVLIGDTVNK